MTKLGLTINEAKTSLRNARQERFDFVGYSFGAHRFEANGNWYLGASPSKKSVQRLKTRVAIFWCRAISIHGRKYVTS